MILSSHGLIASQITQFVGLLDVYPNAAAAYSLRKLRAAYTGNAIEVRRTNNDVADIGFTSTGELDTTALLAFTGTGALDNGFITKWYDQSSNGYDATQTTALNQPQIVSSGSVILENGKPSVQFDGTNDYILATGSIFSFSQFSAFVAIKPNSISQDSSFFQIGSSALGALAAGFGGLGTAAVIGSRIRPSLINKSESLSNTDMLLYSGVAIISTSTNDGFLNNVSMTGSLGCRSTTSPLSELVIGSSGSGTFNFSGKISDIIFYDSDESANVNGINTNINDFYSIY
jgi:hypothetical protein